MIPSHLKQIQKNMSEQMHRIQETMNHLLYPLSLIKNNNQTHLSPETLLRKNAIINVPEVTEIGSTSR